MGEITLVKARPKTAEKRVKPGRIHAVLTTLGSEIAQDLIPIGAALPRNMISKCGLASDAA